MNTPSETSEVLPFSEIELTLRPCWYCERETLQAVAELGEAVYWTCTVCTNTEQEQQ